MTLTKATESAQGYGYGYGYGSGYGYGQDKLRGERTEIRLIPRRGEEPSENAQG